MYLHRRMNWRYLFGLYTQKSIISSIVPVNGRVLLGESDEPQSGPTIVFVVENARALFNNRILMIDILITFTIIESDLTLFVSHVVK